MNNRIFYHLLALFLIIFWAGLIWLSFQLATKPKQVIECSMAEFHPDFTDKMRKACRERRSHKL